MSRPGTTPIRRRLIFVAEPDGEYDRGHKAGGIDERLASHDKHFAAINGSIGQLATEMHRMTLAVQRLGDQAESNARTVITTAAALKDANDVRRSNAETSWSPVTRVLALLGGLATLVGLYLALK